MIVRHKHRQALPSRARKQAVCFAGHLLLLSFPSFSADLLIRNVNIVDVKTGNILPHRSILIHGDRIRSITAATGPTRGAQVVDGHNRYVIPGLWDMHVHLWYKEHQFPMFLAWGVTGVRDMGSDLAQVNRWRAQIKKHELAGPHIETCGPSVDGFPSGDSKLPVLMVRNPNEARKTYDRLEQDLNVDFVNVLRRLPRDAYFALMERARKWGLPVAGAVPDSVTAEEAVAARQSSMEHLTGIALACSREEHKLRPLLANAIERKDAADLAKLAERVLDTYDPAKANTLFDRMHKFDSYQVPALLKLRSLTYADSSEVVREPRLKYIPAAIRKTWEDPREREAKLSEEALELADREYQRNAYIVDQMQRFGVPIMAGTGTGDPYTFPGYDLHRELQLLVSAGLTSLQALRSATLTPAEYLEAGDSLGTVAPGRMADLVLLDADPLQDIRNTKKVAAVILGGRYLPKPTLDAMLLHARQ